MSENEPIFAIHSALMAAKLEYAAYSSNGVNLVGEPASIRAAMSAFNSHAQIDGIKTQLRHWREECGKLHGKADWQPIETAPKDGDSILLTDARVIGWTQIAAWDEHHQGWQADDSPAIWHKDMFTHWMPIPNAPLTPPQRGNPDEG